MVANECGQAQALIAWSGWVILSDLGGVVGYCSKCHSLGTSSLFARETHIMF